MLSKIHIVNLLEEIHKIPPSEWKGYTGMKDIKIQCFPSVDKIKTIYLERRNATK